MKSANKSSALANLKARRLQSALGESSPSTSGTAAPASRAISTVPITDFPQSAAGRTTSSSPPPNDSPAPASSSPPPAPAPGPSPRVPPDDISPLPTRQVEAFAWVCSTCQRECVPVRSESRCLCGHRLREHDSACATAPSRCKSARCRCRGFFFIVAEGAWVLRCRCKHKHVEHDPATHVCAKAGCGCKAFDSPWVCNCDHPWSDHKQLVQNKEVVSVRDMLGGLALAEVGGGGPAREVNDYSALKRGEFADQL